MKRRILLIAALCSLALTACAGAGHTGKTEEASGESVSFRYQEERSVWQAGEPEKLPQEDYGPLTDFCETENGDVYYLFATKNSPVPDQPDFDYHVVKCGSGDGVFEEIPLEIDPELYIEKILVSDAGDILLFDWKRAYVYPAGAAGSGINFPAFFRSGAVFSDEGYVICKSHASSAYLAFDPKTGENTGEVIGTELLYGIGGNYNTLVEKDAEGIFFITGMGIYMEDGADGWTLAVPSEKTSMYLTNFDPREAWREGEEYFVADANTRYHYFKVEAAEVEEIRLKVLSVCENGFLKEAMVRYQIEHPEVTIDYEVMQPEPPADSQTFDMVMQKVGAQLLSKDAADMYDLSYLPWEDYAEKGYLSDLTEITEEFGKTGDYFENIWNAYRGENGIQAIPLYFYADYIFCSENLAPHVGSIQDFAGYLAENPEKQGLLPYFYRNNLYGCFLPLMYQFYSQDMYDGGEITPESLGSFLESAKVIWDRLSEDELSAVNPYGGTFGTYEVSGILGSYDSSMLQDNGEGAVLIIQNAVGASGTHPIDGYVKVPTGRFHPAFLLGIRQASPQKEEAEKFFGYMINYVKERSMQEKIFRTIPMALPVYKPAIPYWMQNLGDYYIRKENVVDGRFKDEQWNNVYVYVPTDEDIKRFAGELEELKTPARYALPQVDLVYGIFADRVKGYFEGDKSLDRAVDEICNGIRLIAAQGK